MNGAALIEARFGELGVEFDFALPATVFAAYVGRPFEQIVDREAWHRRGWRIAAIVEEDYPWRQRLRVPIGAVE